MLYLTYAGSHPEQIKIQVRGDSNVFSMPVLELSAWYTMGEVARKDAIRTYVQELSALVDSLSQSGISGDAWTTTIRNATEISTPSVLLSLPADQVLAGLKGVNNDENAMVDTMYQNILAWEEELFIANKVQGIIASDTALTGYQLPHDHPPEHPLHAHVRRCLHVRRRQSHRRGVRLHLRPGPG